MHKSNRKYNIDKEYPDNISVRRNNGIIIEVNDSYNRPFFKDLTNEIMPYAKHLLSKRNLFKPMLYQVHILPQYQC